MIWKDAIKTAGKGALDGAFLNGIGQGIAGVGRILSNNKAGIKKFYVDETGSVKIDGVGGSKADVTTGIGYNAGDTQVRVDGDWTENDMKQALLGHPPRGLGSPDIHHGGQMPGGALHEVLPGQHRNNPALHQNTYNQGVTPEMRMEDRQLHWWYRAREQGTDELLPDSYKDFVSQYGGGYFGFIVVYSCDCNGMFYIEDNVLKEWVAEKCFLPVVDLETGDLLRFGIDAGICKSIVTMYSHEGETLQEMQIDFYEALLKFGLKYDE